MIVIIIIIIIIIISAVIHKTHLVQVDAVYDLIDILETYTTSPDVATEALSVIACLLDNG